MSVYEVISDYSQQLLLAVPPCILELNHLKMLYLEGNLIETLPINLFQCLTKLTWLDLRNNKLKEIPETIAYHPNLENLLLTNNLLTRLPNEIGLIPKLKVLQVFENPLVYPPPDIVIDGTRAICDFLLTQHEKQLERIHKMETISEKDDETDEAEEESPKKLEPELTPSEMEFLREMEDLDRNLPNETPRPQKQKQDPKQLPLITITCLSKNNTEIRTRHRKQVPKVEKTEPTDDQAFDLGRRPSKTNLKPHANSNKYVGQFSSLKKQTERKITDQELKQQWLGKLQEVMTEQEKLLQQERNLKALADWRFKRKYEAPRRVRSEDIPKAPYDVLEQFSKMPNRNNMHNEMKEMIRKGTPPPNRADIEKMINDLVGQLKEMEGTYSEMKSPRTEIEQAGRQIKMIMNIHKKLISLQASNESIL